MAQKKPLVVHGYELTEGDVLAGEDLVLVGGNLPYFRGYFLAELEFDEGFQQLVAQAPPFGPVRDFVLAYVGH